MKLPIISILCIPLLSACSSSNAPAVVRPINVKVGADLDEQTVLDPSLLNSLPRRRGASLANLAITERDSPPEIYYNRMLYIKELRIMTRELLSGYYWHSDFPSDIDVAIEKRATYLDCLRYPGSASTGCFAFSAMEQLYAISMYEEHVVAVAEAVCGRFCDPDITAIGGEVVVFDAWLKAWNRAGLVENAPTK